jgi:hypothetical protein
MKMEVCPVCAKKGIVRPRDVTIEETEGRVVKTFSPCEHKNIVVTVSNGITLREGIKGKVKDKSGKTKRKFLSRQKISKRGKEARENLDIDIAGNRKRHHVEEQDEKGDWRTVHHEDEPLKKSNKNRK